MMTVSSLVFLIGSLLAGNDSPVPSGPDEAAATATVESSLDAPPAISLMGWWGPPPSAQNLAIYRQAFLNTLPVTLQRAQPEALDRAEERGLTVALELPADAPFDLDAIPEDVFAHPAVWACIVAEGVTLETVAEAIRRAEALRARQPDWLPIVTLLPDPADPAWEGAAASLAAAGVPVLPWVMPYLSDGSTDEAELYAVLQGASQAAERGGAPLWGLVQVTEHADRRRASESDMRLQAYANLAHGARGLVYYTYWGPRPGSLPAEHPMASFGVSMVDTGRRVPSYGYQMARIINAEITQLSPYLEGLTPTGVYFVGEIPEGTRPLVPGTGPITRVDSARALVGYFEAENGDSWAMVVNRQHGLMRSARTQGRTLGIALEGNVRTVHTIERQTGLSIPIPADDGYFTITIPGGTGALLHFERAPEDE